MQADGYPSACETIGDKSPYPPQLPPAHPPPKFPASTAPAPLPQHAGWHVRL